MVMMKKIKPREKDAIIQSLSAGVVPRIGLQHIQVGRVNEVNALIKDIERICQGGAAFRLIIGEYGAGKTFFLQLIRTIALEKGLVTVHGDLAPNRRIHATGGQARALYSELMRNLSTRTKPEGNATAAIVERFISSAIEKSENSDDDVHKIIAKRLSELSELVGGYDFASVIKSYWLGHEKGNDELKQAAIRWLRAEYSTKTDAKNALGVRTIIDDSNFYDFLKLMALFVKQAGYKGLLVGLDELVNLFKLTNAQARKSNYEQILRILNDSLQGGSAYIGFLLGGTPEFLMDPRRGLYSYEALQSRLSQNTFATQTGVVDYNKPDLSLANLQPEDLYILLQNIRRVFSLGEPENYLLPDGGIEAFMRHCNEKIGDAYFRTPRNSIRSFVGLLSLLEQYPDKSWNEMVACVDVHRDLNPALESVDEGEEVGGELTSFNL